MYKCIFSLFFDIVSAFYAEYPKNRIYVSGSVYTKSRFLGLSLGVHNIGKGEKPLIIILYFSIWVFLSLVVIVTLMDHNEEYEFTLPSAYARYVRVSPTCT